MSSTIRTSRCAFNAATALRRIFVTGNTTTFRLPIQTHQPVINSSRSLYVASTPKATTNPKILPKDGEILNRYPVVHLVSDSGRLSPPTNTSSILSSINSATHSLITVALPSPRIRSRWEAPNSEKLGPEDSVNYQTLSSHSLKKSKALSAEERSGFTEIDAENVEVAGAFDPSREWADSPTKQLPTLPICKIVPVSHFLPDKFRPTKANAGKSKEDKKKKANPALTLKTLELNWAIDGNDLKHRMETLKGFLRKGYRVDILLVGKRKKRKAEPEEAENTLAEVREAIRNCEGAKEWKDREGALGGMMRLFAQGQEVVSKEEPKKIEQVEEDKEEKEVFTTKTGKKLSKNRMKQLGMLKDEPASE